MTTSADRGKGEDCSNRADCCKPSGEIYRDQAGMTFAFLPVQPVCGCFYIYLFWPEDFMVLAQLPVLAAVGYSLVYLLAGGGLGGAILIFIVAKMLGK